MSQTRIVAAMDFGTTYSGYAYSTRHDYRKDPLKITMNRMWAVGVENFTSYKTPTSILFNSDMSVKAFGFEAECQYQDMCIDGREKSFHFFRHFKLLLISVPNLNRDVQLESLQGTKKDALVIFTAFIKYLRDHMMKTLKVGILDIDPKDVHWVLTVPAIWNDAAKQFMREAALLAGIDDERLQIVLEPEAAAVYCRKLPIRGRQSSAAACPSEETWLEAFAKNTSYMILDIGGGTADIAVHEITEDGSIKQVMKSSGGTWGGLRIDEDFNQLMATIYSEKVMKRFHSECPEDSFRLTKNFEFQKCLVKSEGDDRITVMIPSTLRDIYKQETNCEIPKDQLYGDQVSIVQDKLRFRNSLLKTAFQPTITSIVDHVKLLRQNPEVAKVKYAFVVGGVSQSPLLLEALQAITPEVRFIVPVDSVLAVVKGAALLGHDPSNALAARKSAYTYGAEIVEPFDSRKHPPQMETTIDGMASCGDVFDPIIREEEILMYDHVVKKVYYPAHKKASHAVIMLYESTKKDVKFITEEGVRWLGYLLVDGLQVKGTNEIHIDFKVGGAELEVVAVEPVSNKTFKARFDFLSK